MWRAQSRPPREHQADLVSAGARLIERLEDSPVEAWASLPEAAVEEAKAWSFSPCFSPLFKETPRSPLVPTKPKYTGIGAVEKRASW